MIVPVMLTIAGSDPSGGAGIQADLKTATALGVYGASVITALTAQNTLGVTGIHLVPPEFVAAQYVSVVSDLDVRAVKIGMLGTAAIVETVAVMLVERPVPAVVVDPVMIATSGDRLLAADAEDAIRRLLVPLATVVTPNVPEATALTGVEIDSVDGLVAAGRALIAMGASAAVVKGGHLGGAESVDVLVTQGGGVHRFEAPRIATANTHGTGCTLSAAIASQLVRGLDLAEAVAAAKDYVRRALESAVDRRVGAGRGPVDHLVAS
jgi:hydroxymethylpyrimidine/phosphomethylpyrimidine kinase